MEIPTPTRPPAPALWARLWPWLMVAAAIVFVGAIRVRLLPVPLERDEGEYAYGGQLLLQGIPPYEFLYSMKLPGTSLMYALGMLLFGETTTGIHLTLILVNSLTIIFVFLLGRSLAGSLAGALSAICYGFLSLSPSVLGLAAHATQFVVLFAVPGTWLLLRAGPAGNPRTLFASGLLFGLACLMKQPGLCFGAFGVVYLGGQAWCQRQCASRGFVRRLLVFGAGLALPVLLVCALLAWAGVFPKFWFWTISYARSYEQLTTWQDGIQGFLGGHLRATRDMSMGAWLLVLAGGLTGCALKPLRPALCFTGVWWLFAFGGTSMGLYYRPHYFILLLPAFALFLGLATVALQKVMPARFLADVFKSLPVLALGLILSWMLYYHGQVLFQLPANQVSNFVYRDNPFMEAVGAADQIRAHSAPTDRIAVIGSEPEIFFYAHRHSATGYIYTYPLMEAHPYALLMQQAMAREIEAARPEFLVQVAFLTTGVPLVGSSRYLTDWAADYAGKMYTLAGTVRYADGKTICTWGPTNARPPAGQYLLIYQRRTAPQ